MMIIGQWMFENVFYILETIGICSFALSGILMAKSKNFDPVGLYIIACVTAFGGGTFRDLILDVQPVYWISHWEYPVVILGLTFLFYLTSRLKIKDSWLIISDAMGLGLFTITGAQTAYLAGYPMIVVAILATMTGTFGGLMRDVLCTEIPMILKKSSYYASLSFLGANLYVVMMYFELNDFISLTVAVVFIFIFRLLAYRFNWRFT
jgi:uncharacterized membrane protein YeiH